MVGESNQNGFFIQIDASNFAEFEISEFKISRFNCRIASDTLRLNGIVFFKLAKSVYTDE